MSADRQFSAAVCVSLALLTASVVAKGPTTRIVIKDLDRGNVSEITDRSVLDQFQVWAGKGTYSGPPDRTTEATQGFIIDWQAGVVDRRPSQLRRYEISFYVTRKTAAGSPLAVAPAEELAYVVLYENDPSTRAGLRVSSRPCRRTLSPERADPFIVVSKVIGCAQTRRGNRR